MSPTEPKAGRGPVDPSKATPSKGKRHSSGGQVIPRSRRPSSLHYCIRPGTNSPLTESPSTPRESPRTAPPVLAPRATPEESLIDSYSSGSSEDEEDDGSRATVLDLHDDLDARRKSSDGSPETGSQATGSTLGTGGRIHFRCKGNDEGPAPVKSYKHYSPQVEGNRNGSAAMDRTLRPSSDFRDLGDSVGLNSLLHVAASSRLYVNPPPQQPADKSLSIEDWHPTKTKPHFSTPDHLYHHPSRNNNLPKPVHAPIRQSDDVRSAAICSPLDDVFSQTKKHSTGGQRSLEGSAAAEDEVTIDGDPQSTSPSPMDRLTVAERSDGNPKPNAAHFQFQSRSEDTNSRRTEEDDLRLTPNHFDQLLHG